MTEQEQATELAGLRDAQGQRIAELEKEVKLLDSESSKLERRWHEAEQEVERLRGVLKALPGAWADHTDGPYEEMCEKCRFLKMRADALEGGTNDAE